MDAQQLGAILALLDGNLAAHLIVETLRRRPRLSCAVVNFACPALTYAPSRAMTERRCRGVLKHLDQGQKVGLIASVEIEATFGVDVLVSLDQLKGFQLGDEVSFTCASWRKRWSSLSSVEVLNQQQPVAYELLTVSGLPAWPRQEAKRRRVA